jgi:spore maturation protein CgeB
VGVKLVVFGLAVSSSWGNGHATLWRGLARALHQRGHLVVFFEQDRPFYAAHRDQPQVPGMELVIYSSWEEVRWRAASELRDADVGMVTSFCPDAAAASELVLSSPAPLRCYYDLDTPVTLAALDRGEPVFYLPPGGLGAFDLVLSYTGGAALGALRTRLGARAAVPLFGSVDPEIHRPAPPRAGFAADLSYLGTYADDRQAALERLLLEPARRLPRRRFLIGGAQYPAQFPWSANIFFVRHVPPADHPAFYASSPLTLNLTRAPMAALGHCPSARLFEAAACGVPVLSDAWEGLNRFFRPGEEILVARTPDDVQAAVELSPEALRRLGQRARERTLAEHTALHRAMELEELLGRARRTSALDRGETEERSCWE